MTTWLAGFSVALGLIVAIGAQNAWVLGMSVRRCHPWSIALTCAAIDGVLIAIGVVSFQQIQRLLPGVVPWLTVIGVLLLLWLAVQALLRAIRGNEGLSANDEAKPMQKHTAILTALAISLLNPHVYLDTVVLLGSLASSSSQPWVFYSGSFTASILWFSSLAALGKPLGVWLKSPARWRVFDGCMAAVLSWVAFSLYKMV